jgi:hypothetical protein
MDLVETARDMAGDYRYVVRSFPIDAAHLKNDFKPSNPALNASPATPAQEVCPACSLALYTS